MILLTARFIDAWPHWGPAAGLTGAALLIYACVALGCAGWARRARTRTHRRDRALLDAMRAIETGLVPPEHLFDDPPPEIHAAFARLDAEKEHDQ